jgi:hypothetical protein
MVGALKALGIELEERWEQGEMIVKVCLATRHAMKLTRRA